MQKPVPVRERGEEEVAAAEVVEVEEEEEGARNKI